MPIENVTEPIEYVGDLMSASATEILETMFFVCPQDVAAPEHWNAPSTGASVVFRGERSGRFEVHLEQDLAHEMTAGFVGVMDPSDVVPEQVSQVTCELANMVCGVTLSRMAPGAIFSLNGPCQCLGEGPTVSPVPLDSTEIVRWLDSGQGLIRLALAWNPDGRKE